MLKVSNIVELILFQFASSETKTFFSIGTNTNIGLAQIQILDWREYRFRIGAK